MSMTKEYIIDKLENGAPTFGQIKGWIGALPAKTNKEAIPNKNKVGDVYMHPVFLHPAVLLEKKNDGWLCGLLTTNGECTAVLCEAESRFYHSNFFTKVLFIEQEPINGVFHGVYDNDKHLKKVVKKLKKHIL